MTYRIGGEVVDQGSGVSGQPVFVVDTGDADPTNWTVEAATTTNADGSWSVIVNSGGLERYHAVAQFEDGSTLKNAESKPFVTGQPVVRPVEIPIQFNIPAPQTIGTTIPDSWEQNADHEYDSQDLTANEDDRIDPFSDQIGTNDLPATGSPFYETNTNIAEPSVSTDGSDNNYFSSSYDGTGSSLSVAFVIEPLTTSGDNDQFEFGTGGTSINLRIDNGTWQVNIPGDSSNNGGSASTNSTYAGIVATDGSSLVLDIADTEVINVSVGTANNTGVAVSRNLANAANQGNSNFHILRSFTKFKNNSERDEIINYLESKFDFTSASP